MTASTVKDVVDNLERYYDAFDGEKKAVDTVLDRIDALLSREVVMETTEGEELDYDGVLKDLDAKLQNGWFMESAEVKQVDQMTIEYLARIMTDKGTMATPRYRATIGDDYKITRIVSVDPAAENTAPSTVGARSVVTVDEDDSVLQAVKMELDQAANEPDDDLSTLASTIHAN